MFRELQPLLVMDRRLWRGHRPSPELAVTEGSIAPDRRESWGQPESPPCMADPPFRWARPTLFLD